jgi:hypothetical protein
MVRQQRALVMWRCPKCNENIEDQFDSCWRCADPSQSSASAELPNQDKKDDSPVRSALSLACPVCAVLLALCILLPAKHSSGSISPDGLVAIVMSLLVLAPAGIILGVVGLVKERWPLMAIAGIILSVFLLFGICLPLCRICLPHR